MAPKFLSKLVKATTPSPATTTTNDDPTTNALTTETKTSKRHSRDRSGSTKSGKSRQPSVDTSSSQSPRTSFQFGFPTLSRNKAASTPLAPKDENNTHIHSNSSSSLHKKGDSVATSPAPPVPPLPETLTVAEGSNAPRSRRNSIISVFGGKNKDKPIVRLQHPSTDTPPSTAHSDPFPTNSTNGDNDIPAVSIVASPSRESLATTSTTLGVTIIPPSPLLYASSLTDTHSGSFDLDQDVEETPVDKQLHDKKEPRDDSQPKSAEDPAPTPVTATAIVTSPTTSTENTSASVLVSFLGRRPRTASISSAISGYITGAVSKPTTPPEDKSTPTTTPTTATTIKANPFQLEENSDDIPPVPSVPDTVDNMARSNHATLAPEHEVQRKSSSRSLNNVPPPLDLNQPNFPTNLLGKRNGHSNHARAATSPPNAFPQEESTGTITDSIVESPTAMKMPEYPTPVTAGSTRDGKSAGAGATTAQSAGNNGGGSGFASLLSPRKVDDDAASIISTSSKMSPDKKRSWKRSMTRKPTGLAGAIAASGLAIANPGVSPVYQAQASPPLVQSVSSGSGRPKSPNASSPYLSKSPSRSATSTGAKSSKSVTSPKSSKSTSGIRKSSGSKSPNPSRAHTINSAGGSRKHHRRPSASAFSDGASSYGGNLSTAGLSEYYSGESDGGVSRISRRRTHSAAGSGNESDTEDETDSSDDDSSEDDDFLDDLNLEDDDMPVTGFAVASNKRNADFHELFPNIPEGDYLIEDYGCALQREILIQGRLYISENHVCFHANIFGWITDLSIPICEIISLEKKMTAFVIPNAIQITTRQAKYSFASFLSRDTTFDVIYNIWRVSRPDDVQSIRSGRGSLEGGSASFISGAGGSATGLAEGAGQSMNGGVVNGAGGAGGKQGVTRKATQCGCGREGRHYTETALEAVFPGSPEKIHNLIFASGFIKEFLVTDQKVLDIQMSDWMPVQPGSKLLSRNMSYIKPLNASMGPKQTKCEIKDEIEHIDFDQYVSTITSTRTPDVPSGGVFTVKTRTCIMWASPISSRVIVTTQVEWTGRSFIKGIIERSAIDGQKAFHSDLEKGMRAYIQEHKSEFVPEGMDASVLDAAPAEEKPSETAPGVEGAKTKEADLSEEARNKQREHERNRRAFQWALDTFDGAFEVAQRSTKGAVELVRDAWDQSSSTTILYFVIVILVISNLYTLVRMGKKEEIGRRKEMMKAEERERWVQSVVMTLWEELASGKKDPFALRDRYPNAPVRLQPAESPRAEDTPVVVVVEPTSSETSNPLSWKEELAHLQETLATVEERVRTIKASIAELENLNLNQLD
ncbi:hypothetical protein CC1G_00611 [Coprinopsis cinerea okayama7|uniref:VASt domain-containing protein n=1 Tax=Coprinopsis cinerea (strain Okayama-7 / 130 / ATCC MYA-4618 / FGSC 9003) TaxID=240176 RepID=A8N3J2_COPC7|nr:hypothetical protein CC1G_00611 [Coprinopsis cinerea okayama7\|eukprot:XP_001829432.2 hypothetical protein CC1G_00611 [Coprinopsis cinerea okayama7\